MPEPFKNLFSPELVALIASHVSRCHRAFDADDFQATVLDGFEQLELKQRSNRITEQLLRLLPEEYPKFERILLGTLHPETEWPIGAMHSDETGLAGWAIMPLSMAIAERGRGHLKPAMAALREMTMRFSAEFAVRPLIAANPAAALRIIMPWTSDPNEHVRRLASEGTRPRLPWGMGLEAFVADPSPLLPLLERLKDDPSEYVRRSVANNLNDISKDHPAVTLAVCQRWRGADANTDRLVKHALRTLLKRGDAEALALFDFAPIKCRHVALTLAAADLRIGDTLEFHFSARIPASHSATVRLEYAIEYARPSGVVSRKVFKISEREPPADGHLQFTRRHRLADNSIRKHHPGPHAVVILVNGQQMARRDFELLTV